MDWSDMSGLHLERASTLVGASGKFTVALALDRNGLLLSLDNDYDDHDDDNQHGYYNEYHENAHGDYNANYKRVIVTTGNRQCGRQRLGSTITIHWRGR